MEPEHDVIDWDAALRAAFDESHDRAARERAEHRLLVLMSVAIIVGILLCAAAVTFVAGGVQ